ncbi:hypothetical protein ACCUM_0347 [Candidatus Accumulibacter phosphatis]|uniref:Uncharacterized protein n=1 Tax=Candidatus Accumulibacter phosphatis TaxID=327160 RepID=A0A5S4EKH7_9PROT|nr:hypothetical protein ACCUM_0347 [Candidatus Accumulibacter phosphatis]
MSEHPFAGLSRSTLENGPFLAWPSRPRLRIGRSVSAGQPSPEGFGYHWRKRIPGRT